MGYKVISNGPNIQYDVVEIICDTRADLNEVPTTFGVGSYCIVLENSSVHMLGNDYQWHEL